jgi:hypothetical protein
VAVDRPFVYGYNAFTDPTHRGRGLHIFGVSAAAQRLRPEGFIAIIAYIDADNVAPLMSARKMGESFVGFVVLFRALGKFHWLVSPGCGKIGFRVSRRPVADSTATLSRPA